MTTFQCPFLGCGQTYTSRSSYRQHLRKHDRSRGGKVCPVCSCVFKKKSQLRKHLSIHKSDPERDGTTLEALESIELEPHVCDVCQKKFVTHGSLSKHKKRHEKKPFSCKFCPEKFSFYHDFQKHVKRNHPEPYKCEICEKGFKKQYLLNEHKKNSHHGKIYRCEECGKTYKSSKSLQRHKKVKHEQTLQFWCRICNKRFSENCVLKKHLSNVHGLSESDISSELNGGRESSSKFPDDDYDEDLEDDDEDESALMKRKREVDIRPNEFESKSKKRKYDKSVLNRVLGRK